MLNADILPYLWCSCLLLNEMADENETCKKVGQRSDPDKASFNYMKNSVDGL